MLALLIAFPLGLIGIGIVLAVVIKPQASSIAEVPKDSSTQVQAPSPTITEESERELLVPAIDSETIRTKPLANNASNRTRIANKCWFQMESGGRLIGNRCTVNSRVNNNGDKVFDVIEPSGLKRSVVLLDNKQVEVFLRGKRYTGTWEVDSNGDVRVTVGGGTFAFTPN